MTVVKFCEIWNRQKNKIKEIQQHITRTMRFRFSDRLASRSLKTFTQLVQVSAFGYFTPAQVRIVRDVVCNHFFNNLIICRETFKILKINMNHTIKIFDLSLQENKKFLNDIIIPIQTHSTNIVEIKTGGEGLQNCDGVFTSNKNNFSLGIQTADCAAICFSDNEKYGVIHAGWRGLVNGIIEKMLNNFVNPKIFVSPILNEFEIQKDDCYEKINQKFGEKYFYVRKENNKTIIIFKFLDAIKSVLPQNTIFDSRDTFKNSNLASWRRDGGGKRNYTIIYGQNLSTKE